MGNMTNIPYMLPSHVHHLALFISIYDPVISAEVIHGNNLFKEPYMSLSSHVHHFAAFALYISIYDLVIFIDEYAVRRDDTVPGFR